MHLMHQSLRLLRNPRATAGVPRRSRSAVSRAVNRCTTAAEESCTTGTMRKN